MEAFFTKSFDRWDDFHKNFIEYCDWYYQPVRIRSSNSIRESDTRCKQFKHYSVVYICHHHGQHKQVLVDNSRSNQETNCSCNDFTFRISYKKKLNKLCFGPSINLNHNHAISKNIYKNYSWVRSRVLKHDDGIKQLTNDLIAAKAPIHEIQ